MSVPAFTQPVPDNGYRWWYLDAISDDDQHALTIIVFIGSVFSPYYAWARKKGNAEAAQFCSVNVALYGKPSRWCMTERAQNSVRAEENSLAIGKSQIRVDGHRVIINIDEIAVPLPRRVRGTVTLDLPDYDLQEQPLDQTNHARAQHFWQPVAPQTRIDVAMESPEIQWRGHAYMDSNHGRVPLESSFKSWTWSRSHAPSGDTTIFYDVITRDGDALQRNFCFKADGSLKDVELTKELALPSTRYFRIKRPARSTGSVITKSLKTLEDAPFYARSRYQTVTVNQDKTLPENSIAITGIQESENHAVPETAASVSSTCEDTLVTVHESLDLDRFDSSWVRLMLPFRMPRITRARLPGHLVPAKSI